MNDSDLRTALQDYVCSSCCAPQSFGHDKCLGTTEHPCDCICCLRADLAHSERRGEEMCAELVAERDRARAAYYKACDHLAAERTAREKAEGELAEAKRVVAHVTEAADNAADDYDIARARAEKAEGELKAIAAELPDSWWYETSPLPERVRLLWLNQVAEAGQRQDAEESRDAAVAEVARLRGQLAAEHDALVGAVQREEEALVLLAAERTRAEKAEAERDAAVAEVARLREWNQQAQTQLADALHFVDGYAYLQRTRGGSKGDRWFSKAAEADSCSASIRAVLARAALASPPPHVPPTQSCDGERHYTLHDSPPSMREAGPCPDAPRERCIVCGRPATRIYRIVVTGAVGGSDSRVPRCDDHPVPTINGASVTVLATLASPPPASASESSAAGPSAYERVILDFLSSHTTDCAGQGHCVCDRAWPLVGLSWGDVEGARRRLREPAAQPAPFPQDTYAAPAAQPASESRAAQPAGGRSTPEKQPPADVGRAVPATVALVATTLAMTGEHAPATCPSCGHAWVCHNSYGCTTGHYEQGSPPCVCNATAAQPAAKEEE